MPKTVIIPLTSRAREPFDLPPQSPPRFLSLHDVLDRLTISRSLLYQLIKDPVRPFPAPVHLRRRSVWVEGEVEEYMRQVVETGRSCQ
jgi:predicted DNA-binding transcriptional regulator AlpA